MTKKRMAVSWKLDDIWPVEKYGELTALVEKESIKLEKWWKVLDPEMSLEKFREFMEEDQRLEDLMSRMGSLPMLLEAEDRKNSEARKMKSQMMDIYLKHTERSRKIGHWLKGNLGQDRKDIGMAIRTLATVFQYLPKEKRPGIIVKTSHAGFSVIDREGTREVHA